MILIFVLYTLANIINTPYCNIILSSIITQSINWAKWFHAVFRLANILSTFAYCGNALLSARWWLLTMANNGNFSLYFVDISMLVNQMNLVIFQRHSALVRTSAPVLESRPTTELFHLRFTRQNLSLLISIDVNELHWSRFNFYSSPASGILIQDCS